LLSGLGGGT